LGKQENCQVAGKAGYSWRCRDGTAGLTWR
jgi:hypothetical protein